MRFPKIIIVVPFLSPVFLQLHELQHARLPCPSPSPRACSNSCPLSQWYHPTVSSSVIPFSSYNQSFPASGSFPMSQLFPSGDQSIEASFLASVLPVNIQGWFPLGLTGLISLLSKGLSRVFSNTTCQKHQFFGAQPSLWPNSHITGVDFHFLLQRIFPTQGLNLGLPHCRQMLYHLSHQGSPS